MQTKISVSYLLTECLLVIDSVLDIVDTFNKQKTFVGSRYLLRIL